MPFLPLNIDVRGKRILVVGGGPVALRKTRALLDADSLVSVVSPLVSAEISQLADNNLITLLKRSYQNSDLDGVFLVVAATSDPAVNQMIAQEAGRSGILVNVSDAPESGNCHFPARLRRGDLEITVSTNGSCPGFAAAVRDQIAETIGNEFGIALKSLAAERDKLLTDGGPSTYNAQVLRARIRELLEIITKHKERVP